MTTAGIPQTGSSTGSLTGRGRVLFVGAGPGSAELLTVRAREILANTAAAWVDPAVTTQVRAIIAEALPVPEDKRAAAEQEWEADLAAAKAAGARRRPRRPEPVTAADIVLAAPSRVSAPNGESVVLTVQKVGRLLRESTGWLHGTPIVVVKRWGDAGR